MVRWDDKMTLMTGWPVDRKTGWQDDMMMGWPDDRWQDYRMKWTDDQMDDQMSRWPDDWMAGSFADDWTYGIFSLYCILHESTRSFSVSSPALIWIVLLYRGAKIKHLNIRAAPRDSDKWCHGAGRFQWTSYKYITNTAPSILHFLYQLHLPLSQLPPTTFCPPVSSWI